MKTIRLLVVLSLLTFSFTACIKEEVQETILSAQEDALASNLFDDVFEQTDDAHRTKEDEIYGDKKRASSELGDGCPSITIDNASPNEYPKTVTINFGDSCVGNDGRIRSGKIISTITGRYREAGTKITTLTENYYVDGYKVEGTKTIINAGRNENDLIYFTVTVTDGKITTDDGKIIERNASRTRTWTEGEETRTIWDDVYEISGTTTGINSNGKSWTSTITKPLMVAVGCRWIKAGKLTVAVEDGLTLYVDYGDGECDNQATVVVNGKERTFTMR